ncbi:MAG: DUF2321 domain-containing protein [Sphaerochaeta sp.]|nr:DUF2321 domain-containing protein [Sphaerochaeta sp.]
MGVYRVAEICLNGHVSTSSADTSPELREKYCSKCGESTITQCPNCQSSIRGNYYVPGVISFHTFICPSFCHNCGRPFPWTERSLQAASELMELSGKLEDAELIQFRTDLDSLMKDTPQTKVASFRVKTFLSKVGKEIASGVRDILVDIVSETAKKAIWG